MERWVFLYYNHEEVNLDVVVLENDDTPAMNPKTTPILLLDLWEHAYYLDVSETRRTNEQAFFKGPIGVWCIICLFCEV